MRVSRETRLIRDVGVPPAEARRIVELEVRHAVLQVEIGECSDVEERMNTARQMLRVSTELAALYDANDLDA